MPWQRNEFFLFWGIFRILNFHFTENNSHFPDNPKEGTQRYNKYRNESVADGTKKDIQKWTNTLHLRCWDCQSSPAFNETVFASSTSTSSQWDIDVSDDVVHQAVKNFGNFLSKEKMSETVETATPEDLARLETDGKHTNNVLLSGIFTRASINITSGIAK